jgi:hypothetical protein
MAREAISTAPPGGKGQISRRGLLGKACAKAAGDDSNAPAMPTETAKDVTQENEGFNLMNAK